MKRLDFASGRRRLWWNIERPAIRRAAKSRRGGPRRRPRVEAIEPRHLLATLTVNTTSDVVDGVTTSIASLVSNPGSDGAISLREAIQAANNTANTGAPDEIHFAISGAGVRTIQPATALPTITNPVVIDATTQPGYVGEPLIELDGSGAGSANGLHITAGGSTVRGLVINRFSAYGIRLRTGGGNLIEGNYLGTDTTGTIARANGADGIYVQDSASNTIGGVPQAARNVISGNADDGVTIGGATSTGNLLLGSYIGTDKTGLLDLGNGDDGIVISDGATNNTVGGSTSASRNIISDNAGDGVELRQAATSNNSIVGNFIGADRTGTIAVANGSDGIEIEGASSNEIGGTAAGNVVLGNRIGVGADGTTMLGNRGRGILVGVDVGDSVIGLTQAGAGNIIAHNGAEGVFLAGDAASGNTIRGNSIFYNTKLGVDLGVTGPFPSGVTPNDAGDGDAGANGLQNFPVLVSATTDGTHVQVNGSLNSSANAVFSIDFYSSTPSLGGSTRASTGSARWK